MALVLKHLAVLFHQGHEVGRWKNYTREHQGKSQLRGQDASRNDHLRASVREYVDVCVIFCEANRIVDRQQCGGRTQKNFFGTRCDGAQHDRGSGCDVVAAVVLSHMKRIESNFTLSMRLRSIASVAKEEKSLARTTSISSAWIRELR